jgi:hypothetical protein
MLCARPYLSLSLHAPVHTPNPHSCRRQPPLAAATSLGPAAYCRWCPSPVSLGHRLLLTAAHVVASGLCSGCFNLSPRPHWSVTPTTLVCMLELRPVPPPQAQASAASLSSGHHLGPPPPGVPMTGTCAARCPYARHLCRPMPLCLSRHPEKPPPRRHCGLLQWLSPVSTEDVFSMVVLCFVLLALCCELIRT